jgi:hypothetical protein
MLIREARIIFVMRALTTTLALAVFLVSPTLAAGQAGRGAVRGEVIDSSGGVLPGVTVAAAASDGRPLATTTTDAGGGFVLQALPAGPLSLTFQLEGFAPVSVVTVVHQDAESRVTARLGLAPLSETVVVSAPAPPDPRFTVPAPTPPAPRPAVRPLPAQAVASVCGPAKPSEFPESLGTVVAARDEDRGRLFGSSAELVIDRGRDDGLDVGRNLVIRRLYRLLGITGAGAVGEHTAGLVQIVAVSEHAAVAAVVYACDELRKGDFLASYNPEPIRDPDPVGTPAFYDAARILFADEGQTLGAPQRLMVIDRGTQNGTRVGQRFTLFRQVRGSTRRDLVGDAVVVAVRSDSATIRVGRVIDAVAAGDWAAPQGAPAASRQQR